MELIPWEEWGEAAFDRARAEGKPVFLHIGATWCHWCHVMDQGTYPDPRVQQALRERFVCVRVDNDHQPDVNERYNQGGWPTVAVLDAEGEVLVGRTYVPALELRLLLESVTQAGQRWSIAPSAPDPAPAEPVTLDAAWEAVKKGYDPYHGGFGDFQKFPHVQVCEWLLDRRIGGNSEAGAGDDGMLAKTLDGMAGGGTYDHVEGGFFRYATQDDWTEPHYEKMLEDNARLILLYTRGATATGNAGWQRAAEKAVSWALKHLWSDVLGAFGGSQDADEGYYRLPLTHRHDPPGVDVTVYAGWNGLMAAALVRASASWDRPGLLGLALRVGAHLRTRIDAEGRVSRIGGDNGGLLTDQAEVALGLSALYQATGDATWRDDAARVLAWARDHLRGPDGGFVDRVPGGPGLLRHARRPMPANTTFAEAAWRLHALGGGGEWGHIAREAADAALAEGEPWGFMAGGPAGMRARLDTPVVVVKVNGNPGLLREFLADAHPAVFAVATAEGVPHGVAMACSGSACARPSGDVVEVRRGIQQLLGAAR